MTFLSARAKRAARVALVAVFGAFAALPAMAESLGDTLVTAYRHSALLDQNRALLRTKDEDVAAAMAGLRPIVQWALNHQYTNFEGIDSTSTTLSLTAQMTLYDWGRSQMAIDIAKESVLSTRYALLAIEQNVLLNAVSAYMDMRRAAEQVALQENSLRVIGQEERAARDRFDVGEITATDVSLAQARLSAARAQLAAAQGQLDVAREAYRAATGKAVKSVDAPPPLPKLPKSVNAARAVAQKTHPAILQAQRETAAAEMRVAAAAAERNPTLGATVRGQVDKSGKKTGVVGLEMSQTLYSGGRLSAGHRKAMAGRDAARAALLNASRQVSQSVGTAWANIDVANAQIKAIDRQISAARQAYDGVREEASLGARTTLDVLDAEQDLLSARADKISAQTSLQLAHYQLLAAMGLLTVENLKLGIPTYDPSAYYNAVRDAPYTSKRGENLDRVMRRLRPGG